METSYPSPAFTDAVPGKPPRAGGTPFVAAYTAVHGDYPMTGVEPNRMTSEGDAAVAELAPRVEVLGVWDRIPFAPRITVALKDGRHLTGECRGDELEWDFETELRNLRPWFPSIDWPQSKLENIVEIVAGLERQTTLEALIKSSVP
jgi:hypothetical protein